MNVQTCEKSLLSGQHQKRSITLSTPQQVMCGALVCFYGKRILSVTHLIPAWEIR